MKACEFQVRSINESPKVENVAEKKWILAFSKSMWASACWGKLFFFFHLQLKWTKIWLSKRFQKLQVTCRLQHPFVVANFGEMKNNILLFSHIMEWSIIVCTRAKNSNAFRFLLNFWHDQQMSVVDWQKCAEIICWALG